LITEIGIIVVITILIGLLNVRSVSFDEHYGELGLGSMSQSAANTFSNAPIATIIEPDIIIKDFKQGTRSVDIKIDDILVWDNRHWKVWSNNIVDVAGNEGLVSLAVGGITKDNTVEQTDGPTDELIAQGTHPGGNGAAVTGAATANNTTRTVGDEITRYVERFEFGQFGNEENATGEINNGAIRRVPYNNQRKSGYEVNGITCHQLLTAAHYWVWSDSNALGSAMTLSLGIEARRMSIDINELMFDRSTLFSILDAFVRTN